MIPVGTRPAFNDVHSVAMWMRVVIHPSEFVFEPDGIDHQSLVIPATHSMPEKRWFDIVQGRLLLAVDGNRAPGGHQLVEKGHAVPVLQNLKRDAADTGARDS